MKIDRQQYERAYQLGRKVYSEDIQLKEAADDLENVGVNRNSAIALIANLRRLLDGQCYTRTLSAANTDDYLAWILRDYGEASLKKALSALEQHIDYYRSVKGVTLGSLRAVLEKHRKLIAKETADFFSPEETPFESETGLPPSQKKIAEGGVKVVLVNYYERSAKARNACLATHGFICAVCGFDFEKTFGAIGSGFIHVHHLKNLASIGMEYEVDPIEDLRPVCPNCHAMLHKGPPYTIKELREIIAAQKK